MGNGFLLQAIVYLSAAIVCVPLAKKLGMGSVLGYLIAGILIGPFFNWGNWRGRRRHHAFCRIWCCNDVVFNRA